MTTEVKPKVNVSSKLNAIRKKIALLKSSPISHPEQVKKLESELMLLLLEIAAD